MATSWKVPSSGVKEEVNGSHCPQSHYCFREFVNPRLLIPLQVKTFLMILFQQTFLSLRHGVFTLLFYAEPSKVLKHHHQVGRQEAIESTGLERASFPSFEQEGWKTCFTLLFDFMSYIILFLREMFLSL